jgi:hypothetical protein
MCLILRAPHQQCVVGALRPTRPRVTTPAVCDETAFGLPEAVAGALRVPLSFVGHR